jgi:hypothetical protein
MADKASRETARENIAELRKIGAKISKLNGQIHSQNGSKKTTTKPRPR